MSEDQREDQHSGEPHHEPADRPGDEPTQPLSGWHGHARPFDFAGEYEPAAGASRFLSGSQPLVAAAALEASLELWQRVDLDRFIAQSQRR